LTKHVREVSQR